MKISVNIDNVWTFDLENSGESTPTFKTVGFQARNKIDSQTHGSAKFDRLPISNAFLKIGSKNYPVDILLMELTAATIETTTWKHISKYKTSIDCTLKLSYPTNLLICTNSAKSYSLCIWLA